MVNVEILGDKIRITAPEILTCEEADKLNAQINWALYDIAEAKTEALWPGK